MTSDQIFTVFERHSSPSSLPELSLRLLEQQKETWTILAGEYASLGAVKHREVSCEGFSVFLQFNPGRIVSTGAKVDEKSILERRCFLCVQNLPPDQKGILYQGEFLVLCNPAPIFPQHFTISNINHIPQAIEPFVGTFLNLARELGPALTVFYNGPKCGASAPDHMHFQANTSGSIPVERDAADPRRTLVRKRIDDTTVSTLRNYGREVIVLESSIQEKIERIFLKIIKALQEGSRVDFEPMINVLCSYGNGSWRLILFPRRKHRPDAYFREGDAQVMVSPAAVDIGGLMVTPMERDFDRIDARMMEGILDEVSLEKELVDRIVADL